MNIYWIDAGEQSEVMMIDPELGGPREYYDAVALIAAPTRGRAKSLFLQQFPRLDWTSPISVRLIETGLDVAEGDVEDDTLWLEAHMILNGDNQPYEWLMWEHAADTFEGAL